MPEALTLNDILSDEALLGRVVSFANLCGGYTEFDIHSYPYRCVLRVSSAYPAVVSSDSALGEILQNGRAGLRLMIRLGEKIVFESDDCQEWEEEAQCYSDALRLTRMRPDGGRPDGGTRRAPTNYWSGRSGRRA